MEAEVKTTTINQIHVKMLPIQVLHPKRYCLVITVEMNPHPFLSSQGITSSCAKQHFSSLLLAPATPCPKSGVFRSFSFEDLMPGGKIMPPASWIIHPSPLCKCFLLAQGCRGRYTILRLVFFHLTLESHLVIEQDDSLYGLCARKLGLHNRVYHFFLCCARGPQMIKIERIVEA